MHMRSLATDRHEEPPGQLQVALEHGCAHTPGDWLLTFKHTWPTPQSVVTLHGSPTVRLVPVF
jgi:hypothetical protein